VSRRRRNDEPVEWHFFSFPVAFAFVFGGFFVLLLVPVIPLGLLFTAFLFFTSFGVAHIINHWFRRRTLDRQKRRDEESERERRALAARTTAQRVAEETPPRPRRRRRVRRGGGTGQP
jgi:membrane protein implicated in regulation of membrane protease activity